MSSVHTATETETETEKLAPLGAMRVTFAAATGLSGCVPPLRADEFCPCAAALRGHGLSARRSYASCRRVCATRGV